MSDTLLLSPFSLRKLDLPNRIVISPMGQYSGDAQGRATDWHLVHLGGLALSGAGLLFTEATAVEPQGRISPHDIGMWSDDQIAPRLATARKATAISGPFGSTIATRSLRPKPMALIVFTTWSIWTHKRL